VDSPQYSLQLPSPLENVAKSFLVEENGFLLSALQFGNNVTYNNLPKFEKPDYYKQGESSKQPENERKEHDYRRF